MGRLLIYLRNIRLLTVYCGVGLALLVSLAVYLEPRNPNLPAYQRFQAKTSDYKAGGKACEPPAIEGLPVGERQGKRDACAQEREEHRQVEEDLVQQTRSAEAAQATVPLIYHQSQVLLFGLVFGGATLLAAVAAAYFAKRAADAARDNLTLDHPPRLVVNNVAIWSAGEDHRSVPKIRPGERIEGRAHLVDYGREPAKVTRAVLVAVWLDETLPMVRPFEYPPLGDRISLPPGKMPSDGYLKWDFTTVVPARVGRLRLFVCGEVAFEDRLETKRGMVFCRRYEPKLKRFVAVAGNPDFEDGD